MSLDISHNIFTILPWKRRSVSLDGARAVPNNDNLSREIFYASSRPLLRQRSYFACVKYDNEDV